MATQNGKLLAYLERHPEGVTQLEAFTALGICRLSERVREIEALGYLISHEPEKTAGGARVVRYKLLGQVRNTPLGIESIPRPHGLIYNSVANDPASWDATPMVEA